MERLTCKELNPIASRSDSKIGTVLNATKVTLPDMTETAAKAMFRCLASLVTARCSWCWWWTTTIRGREGAGERRGVQSDDEREVCGFQEVNGWLIIRVYGACTCVLQKGKGGVWCLLERDDAASCDSHGSNSTSGGGGGGGGGCTPRMAWVEQPTGGFLAQRGTAPPSLRPAPSHRGIPPEEQPCLAGAAPQTRSPARRDSTQTAGSASRQILGNV